MKRILIAEDDNISQLLIKTLIRDLEGAEILYVENGAEALRVIESTHIDLLLLDLVMPVMGGKELLKHLKSKSEYSYLSVIVTTTDIDSKIEMFNMGVDDFIQKPIMKDLLIKKINERLF